MIPYCTICGEEAPGKLISGDDCLRIDIEEFVCVKCCNECPFGPSLCEYAKILD
jgi:hypothetical protein